MKKQYDDIKFPTTYIMHLLHIYITLSVKIPIYNPCAINENAS